jgi:flagellar biosynthesis/type III secretory pathway protein FliH
MSFLTLCRDDCGWLATNQRVFSVDEISDLKSVTHASEQLSTRITAREAADAAAIEQGRAKGFEIGKTAALEAGRIETAAHLLQLTNQHQQETQRLQESAAMLAVEIVRRIAGDVAPVDWMIAQARTASAELVDTSSVILKVHSGRAQDVRDKCRAAEHMMFSQVVGVEDVPVGFCQLETPAGCVDIDLDTQLERIGELLNSPSSAVS